LIGQVAIACVVLTAEVVAVRDIRHGRRWLRWTLPVATAVGFLLLFAQVSVDAAGFRFLWALVGIGFFLGAAYNTYWWWVGEVRPARKRRRSEGIQFEQRFPDLTEESKSETDQAPQSD
jgi:hypothetical protein